MSENKHHRWPGGAKCIVAITIDFDGPSWETGRKILMVGRNSHGRYSAKRGIPRYLDILKRQAIPATFFVSGYDAEVHPDTVTAIAHGGHEVGTHGYLHEGWDLGDEEPFYLRKTHDILTDILGAPPTGWRSPSGGKSSLTMRTLLELGYIYDSSDKDHDLPYLPWLDGRELRSYLAIPNNTSSLDDFPFYRVSYTPASEVLVHWKEEFAAIYQEGGFYNLTFHPRNGYGSGSPARAQMIEQLIIHIKQHQNVRFMTLGELARWCLSDPAAWQLRAKAA